MSKGFVDNRTAFEQMYLELNPEGSVTKTESGRYTDVDTAYGWMAFQRAFKQYASTMCNASFSKKQNGFKTFIVGKEIPAVRGEGGKAGSWTFSRHPFKHKTMLRAEQERQRLERGNVGQKFDVFGLIEVPNKVKAAAAALPLVLKQERNLVRDDMVPTGINKDGVAIVGYLHGMALTSFHTDGGVVVSVHDPIPETPAPSVENTDGASVGMSLSEVLHDRARTIDLPKPINHYEYIEEHGKMFSAVLAVNDITLLLRAHGDKGYQYKHVAESLGVSANKVVMVYLLTKQEPYCKHVRDTANGWVDVDVWLRKHLKPGTAIRVTLDSFPD